MVNQNASPPYPVRDCTPNDRGSKSSHVSQHGNETAPAKMNRIHIDSVDDPRLQIFRNLKTTNETRRSNQFLVEGTTLVERLFRSDFEVDVVLASKEKLRNFQHPIPEGVTVYEVSRDLASELVGFRFHLGVIAAANRPDSGALSDVISEHGPGLVLFCEHVIDPQNVGMVIRIGSAFGAAAIVFSTGCADAFSRRAIRVSAANGLFLPIIEKADTGQTLRELKDAGFTCAAAVLADDAVDLSSFTFPERSVIVFGNETHGISQETAAACDYRLTIPMLNGTDSVNVAVASGIFGYVYRSQQTETIARPTE